MLVHHYEPEHKREFQHSSTDVPQGIHRIGDIAKSGTKRAILRGYAHGILSVWTTQALIDALDLRRA